MQVLTALSIGILFSLRTGPAPAQGEPEPQVTVATQPTSVREALSGVAAQTGQLVMMPGPENPTVQLTQFTGPASEAVRRIVSAAGLDLVVREAVTLVAPPSLCMGLRHQLALAEGDLPGAKANLEAWLMLEPESARARRGAAEVALACDEAPAATQALEELGALHPGPLQQLVLLLSEAAEGTLAADGRRELATIYVQIGEPLSAVPHLSRLLKEGGEDADLLYALALAYEEGWLPARAAPIWERYVAKDPGSPRSRLVQAGLIAVNQTPVVSGPGRETGPRWSPDGRELFYCSFPRTGDAAVGTIHRAEALGLGVPRVLPGVVGLDVAPSPDGGTIALTCRKPGAATCAVALRSLVRDEPSVAITAKLGHASHPRWRQDGTGVIYSTESRVVVQTVADLQMQTYSAGIQAGEHVDYPTLAPDGTFGLCSVGRYGDQRVYRLCRFDVDGQEAASLATETAPTEGWGDMHPDISPDGRAALFSSDRECVGAGFDIWVRLLDGTVPEQALIRRAARPAWSPDGRWVAFDRYAGNATLQDLFVARLTGLGAQSR